MTRTIKLKTFLPYTQDKVWQALTDPTLLGSWFMENNIVPKPGHYFTFRMKPQKAGMELRIAKYYLSNLPNTLAILIVAKQRGKKLWLVRAFIQMRQIN